MLDASDSQISASLDIYTVYNEIEKIPQLNNAFDVETVSVFQIIQTL